MDLNLDPSLASGYHSASQKARVITEHWASYNLFCAACASDHILPLNANWRVADYICQHCKARYQLKSSYRPFGRSVTNSAYEPKMQAIESGQVPHYLFLRYSLELWRVTDLFLVPGFFFTPGIIRKRAPLSSTARRAGWIGSTILLDNLPPEARIPIVSNESVSHPETVREAWSQFVFLANPENAQGGWGADIFIRVRELQRITGSIDFSLQDFYMAFEDSLAAMHPTNHNIRPKVRQAVTGTKGQRLVAIPGGWPLPRSKIGLAHIDQLEGYVQAMGSECKTGILIAGKASPRTISYAKEKGLVVSLYRFDQRAGNDAYSFQELSSSFHLEPC